MLFIYARVEDFGDFVFGVGVDDDQGFRDLDLVQELVQSGGFYHGDVKDRVNTSHRVRKTEGEGDGANLHYNLKRP